MVNLVKGQLFTKFWCNKMNAGHSGAQVLKKN